MDDLSLMRIKRDLDLIRTLDLDVPTNSDKVIDFYQRTLPQLLQEIERLLMEIDKLNIRYRLKPIF